MADQLSIISFILFIAAGVFGVIAILFWFIFSIPQVVGDLSGRTAKKSIQQIRNMNEKSGKKIYKSSKVNEARGKLTETMRHEKMQEKKQEKMQEIRKENIQELTREKKQENPLFETELLVDNNSHLEQSEATGLLVDDTETGLLEEEMETAPLMQPKPVKHTKKTKQIKLTMIDDIIMVHTDEAIQ